MSSEEHSDHQGEDQRARWDIKYEQGLPSLTEPDPFFISAYERFVTPSIPKPGAALDLAGGLGRHALWLASRQWRVTVVELSDVAIGKLSHAARELNVIVDLFAGDAAKHKFELARFDLIVLFYHLDRSLFPRIVFALKPRGLLICKMSLRWDMAGGGGALYRKEIPSLRSGLHAPHHHEKPERGCTVVEIARQTAEIR